LLIGTCINCGCTFGCNPNKVPSVRINGNREPVCKDCMDRLIAREEAAGIVPKRYADDAYEAIREEDL
jgi:hypothetical protein